MSEKPKIDVDPDTGLVEMSFEDEEKELNEMLWGKNPNRSSALAELIYPVLKPMVAEEAKGDPDAAGQMTCVMSINSVLDMVMEALPDELAAEVSFYIDHFIGLNLTNHKHGVDLMEELGKALSQIERKDYDTDDDFIRALEALEEHWWGVGQPALNMRNASDAIHETMRKYDLL
ncbi:MAG: hypothetical protein GX224_00030 [Thermoplasmatales archaeon]|nr:hypothetical protein [Thermoplasmatales archaeon]